GTIISYSWVQLSGSGGVTISGSTQAQATVSGLIAGTYVFQLTVTDDAGASGVATVTITVNAAVVQPPVANAGNDTTIAFPASSVMLNGTGSSDPAGEPLTYSWYELSGPAEVTIAAPDAIQPTATGLQPGVYVFGLQVINTAGLTDTASVEVRVVNSQRTTAADTGSAQVSVYPNPVQDVLTVKFTDPGVSGNVLLTVFDMRGRRLISEQVQVVSGAQLLTLNVAGLARGTYALEVVTGRAKSNQLIVKQ
ncbi:MAG TPA: T9SS type A sorting domain-containing protein, partial [Puia sp.]|nr:T9SS type A sorting domain-containing protein [Puia sp.]